MSSEFLNYARQNWLNFGTDERGVFVTRDVAWTIKAMKKEGWKVERTGETQLMADDTIRTYIVAK